MGLYQKCLEQGSWSCYLGFFPGFRVLGFGVLGFRAKGFGVLSWVWGFRV